MCRHAASRKIHDGRTFRRGFEVENVMGNPLFFWGSALVVGLVLGWFWSVLVRFVRRCRARGAARVIEFIPGPVRNKSDV